MTNQFFTHPKTLQRLHGGPLGAHIDAYAAPLYDQGYGWQGGRRQIRLMADLGYWLGRHNLTVDDLSPQCLQSYLRCRWRHLRPHPSDSTALERLLHLLREKGVVAQDPPFSAPGDPLQRVEEDLGRYLLQERGLALATAVY